MAANLRVTQTAAEVVTEDAAAAILRVTQTAAEVVTEDPAVALLRITQLAVEVVTEDNPVVPWFSVDGIIRAYFLGHVIPVGRMVVPGAIAAEFQGNYGPLLMVVRSRLALSFEGMTNAFPTGGFTGAGEIGATFLGGAAMQAGFLVRGSITASFIMRKGQSAGCLIAPPPAPSTARAPNYSY